jgi:hypothetical protein
MRDLPFTWTIGKTRCTHEGYAAHKIVGKFNKPMERVSDVFESPDKAIGAAERLGEGYAAFRIVRVGDSLEPKEPIRRDELPVTVSLNPKK